MCTSEKVAIACIICIVASAAHAQEQPNLGTPVSEDEIARIDLTVMPDGDGLPDGSGNAKTGARVYERYCLACHGVEGQDGLNDTLVGGHGSLTSAQPVKTVGSYWPYATTLFDYIRRAMPYQSPDILSNDEAYALTAYLLFLNGIVDENAEMNGQSLPDVEMPNRDNFVWSYSPKTGTEDD